VTQNKIRTQEFLNGQGLWVVLNAPKANILDRAMMSEINALLDQLMENKRLKLLGFVGEGTHFSFGASVEEHLAERAAGMLEVFHGMFRRLIKLSVFTAAAVRGQCLGGGLELAAFCNRVVAHPEAKLGQPEIQLAVLPPIASLILPLRIGQSHADEINLTGRVIEGTEARERGLVDALAEDPMKAIEQWAEGALVPKSASTLRWALRASRLRFNHVINNDLETIEKLYLKDLMATHDANEGLAAFLEKRKPDWHDD
jgi:cyclohexa-1,5-dienecarbonyl-CoA hydratase